MTGARFVQQIQLVIAPSAQFGLLTNEIFRDLGHHLMPSAHDAVTHCAGLVTRPITITLDDSVIDNL
jgi:hypothetical protein